MTMHNQYTKAPSRRGFTLVELSIVLVIIGLIIGGVLTGQQVIQNARITNAVSAIQGFEAQFQTYQQNYGAVPGDDANAVSRFQHSGLPTTPVGDGNGTLAGNFDDPVSGTLSEALLAWADLRAAGLVKNQTPMAAQPNSPFNGGIYGFQGSAFGSVFTTNVLCLSNVPGTAAQAIDTRLDDGNPSTGSLQAMIFTGKTGESVTGTPATTYDTSQNYTMCVKM